MELQLDLVERRLVLVCVALAIALTLAGCGDGGGKRAMSCETDDDCDGGVCFAAACYEACTRQSDCADDELCAHKVSDTGADATVCVVASTWAGCTADEGCAALAITPCETARCQLDQQTCVVDVAADGATCQSADTGAGTCVAGDCEPSCAPGSAGCGGAVVTSKPIHVRFPMPAELQVVRVNANVSNPFSFRLDLSEVAPWFQVAEGSIDLEETVQYATFQPDGIAPLEAPEVTVTLRVGTGVEQATVCTTGEAYGPATLPLDPASLQLAGTVEPKAIAATDQTLATINAGAVTGCIDVVPPVSGQWTLSQLALDFLLKKTCTEEPADLSGTWSGTYTCQNHGYEDSTEDGTVELVITQDGRQATYTDEGGAFYTGVICGRTFSFAGGRAPEPGSLDGYFESGSFVMNADGQTATKTSTWHGFSSWGDCADDLTRRP